jgi:hypothetical protein
VTLETAKRLDPALAVGLLASVGVSRIGMDASLGDCDPAKGAVELAIAAAVKSMALAAP